MLISKGWGDQVPFVQLIVRYICIQTKRKKIPPKKLYLKMMKIRWFREAFWKLCHRLFLKSLSSNDILNFTSLLHTF